MSGVWEFACISELHLRLWAGNYPEAMGLCHEIHCCACTGNESAKGHVFTISRNWEASTKIRREV